MIKIGITGGIGSGKSYVCHIINGMGFPVYDCDSEAKRLMVANRHIIESLTALIGNEAYLADGNLNKNAVAQYLFRSQENADRINSIVHPVVKDDFLSWASSQQADLVFMESAILFESGFNNAVDYTLAVCAPMETRIQRAMQRDNATRKQIEARMKRQMTDEEIRTLADYLIENDGKADLNEQIRMFIHRFS